MSDAAVPSELEQEIKQATPEPAATVAPLRGGWLQGVSQDGAKLPYYHHATGNIKVQTRAEAIALGSPTEQKKQANLPERKGWNIEDAYDGEEGSEAYVQYHHAETGAVVNTTEQAQALEKLYQDNPNILAAIKALDEEEMRVEAIRPKEGQPATTVYSTAFEQVHKTAAQVIEMEARAGQAKGEAPAEEVEQESDPQFKNPLSLAVKKRYAVLIGAVLLGIAAVILTFSFPAVVPTLALLMGLTGLLAAEILPLAAVGLSAALLGGLFLAFLERALGKSADANHVFMRNLIIATMILGGIALGLFVGAMTPIVLGAFLDLAALMTFTGPSAPIAGFALLGLAGLAATALLVGAVVGINYALTKGPQAPDPKALALIALHEQHPLPENWQWEYDAENKNKLAAVYYKNGIWQETWPCNDDNPAHLAGSVRDRAAQIQQEEAKKTDIEIPTTDQRAAPAASLHPSSDSTVTTTKDAIKRVQAGRRDSSAEPSPTETAEGGSTAPKPGRNPAASGEPTS